jgi:CelD/BcsL family acetyltransferase involved in cellulose biosynthesis
LSAPVHAAPGGAESSAKIELIPLPDPLALESEWRDLEARSDGSFFVAWSWIGCWIESLGDAVPLELLRARSAGRTVGLALFARARARRHALIGSRRLVLHATGRPEYDILTIECNGLLLERGREDELGSAMLGHLVQADAGWDELVLDGLWHPPAWPLPAGSTLRRRERVDANHFVDLAAVRARGEYLGLIGPKTRSRIRRSCKEYEKLGALGAQVAAGPAQALEFLEGLKTLHQAYWIERGHPGAFANRFFERFHRRLVHDAFNRGEIQLLVVDAGSQRLGYIYNFVYRGRVYNYQSGFNYRLCENHNRPGLVAHARAIECNAALGNDVYDFLAGDVEYKQALGTAAGTMSWWVVQRDRLRFRLEDAARSVYARLRRPPAETASDDAAV